MNEIFERANRRAHQDAARMNDFCTEYAISVLKKMPFDMPRNEPLLYTYRLFTALFASLRIFIYLLFYLFLIFC